MLTKAFVLDNVTTLDSFPRTKLVSPMQPLNTLVLILVAEGNDMLVRLEQFWNAWEPILVAEGNDMLVRFVQFRNVWEVISVTKGNDMLVSPVQPLNAL